MVYQISVGKVGSVWQDSEPDACPSTEKPWHKMDRVSDPCDQFQMKPTIKRIHLIQRDKKNK
jgi:hypothetical protein